MASVMKTKSAIKSGFLTTNRSIATVRSQKSTKWMILKQFWYVIGNSF